MSTGDAHVIQHYNSESTVRKTVVLAKISGVVVCEFGLRSIKCSAAVKNVTKLRLRQYVVSTCQLIACQFTPLLFSKRH